MQNPDLDSANETYTLDRSGPGWNRFEAGAPPAKDLDVLPLAMLILQLRQAEPCYNVTAVQTSQDWSSSCVLSLVAPQVARRTPGSVQEKGARQIRTMASLQIQKPGAMMLGVTQSKQLSSALFHGPQSGCRLDLESELMHHDIACKPYCCQELQTQACLLSRMQVLPSVMGLQNIQMLSPSCTGEIRSTCTQVNNCQTAIVDLAINADMSLRKKCWPDRQMVACSCLRRRKKKDVQTRGSQIRLNGSKSWGYQDAFRLLPEDRLISWLRYHESENCCNILDDHRSHVGLRGNATKPSFRVCSPGPSGRWT